MIEYEKPHISYKQQIDLLCRRGLTIDNKVQVQHILQHIQYYRISGYLHHFRQVSPDNPNERLNTYVSGISFDDVFRLYCFDKKLRILLLDAIETLEVALRSQISYVMGARDPLALDDPKYFNTISGFAKFKVKRDKGWETSPTIFAKAMKRKYLTRPIWVETEIWSIGMITFFFKNTKKTYYSKIAKSMGVPDIDTLMDWTNAIQKLRNHCAHHGRIWNYDHFPVHLPKNPTRQGYHKNYINAYQEPVNVSNRRLYFQCMIIWQMLKKINPESSWNERLKNLIENDFPSHPPHMALRNMGFPDHWTDLPFWGLK